MIRNTVPSVYSILAAMPPKRQTEPSQNYFDEKFEKLEEKLATKECIQQLHDVIKGQRERIEILESKVVVMENYIAKLQDRVDDQEQYQRRLCLRIDGIPPVGQGKDESNEQCLKKVKAVFNELKVDIPDAVIDRAHRIGQAKVVAGKRARQMIVRFTTWRHRSAVYRARKSCNQYKIRLDLTKKRLDTIIKTTQMLHEKGLQGFTFADVNCRLCAKIGNDFHYFKDEDDLTSVIDRLESNAASGHEGTVSHEDE